MPYPFVPNVDKVFPWLRHDNIVGDSAVFDYAIGLLNPDYPSAEAQSLQSFESEPVEPLIPDQQLFGYEGELAAGETRLVPVTLGAVTNATFDILADGPLTVTLVAPSGEVITPETPASNPLVAYTVFSDTLSGPEDVYWQHSYTVQTPADGLWHVQASAATPVHFGVYTTIQSPLQLVVLPDAGSYEPGQTVTIRAGVADRDVLQAGHAVSGSVTLPDGAVLPLEFFDDGTHGDGRAGDSFFAAQFTAPLVDSHTRIVLDSTNGSIVRHAETSVAVVNKTAAVLGVSGERPVDSNGNGYYDALEVDVTLNVSATGEYRLLGSLTAADGAQLVSSAWTAAGGAPLPTGVHTATLRFDGKTLRKTGVDGPYVLDDLYVEHLDTGESLPPIVSSAENLYTTTAYTARQFEGEPLTVAGTAESAEDMNGNGLYDRLAISVTFDVLTPGDFHWLGTLVDADGNLIADASGEGRLDAQTPAEFVFSGGRIAASGRNGPYRLTDVYVTTAGGSATTSYFYDVHTTPAWSSTEFDSTPVAFKNLVQEAVDLDGNGLYDLLTISATVAAIDREGNYSWRGRLVAPDGAELDFVSGGGQLYRDKRIRFDFLGPAHPPRRSRWPLHAARRGHHAAVGAARGAVRDNPAAALHDASLCGRAV